LLPETPAYAKEYRERYGIETIMKYRGWGASEANSEREVVVACDGMTADDYMQMVLSNSLYHMLVQGGVYRTAIEWIMKNHNIGHGKIIRNIYEEWFVNSRPIEHREVTERWNKVINDENQPCLFNIKGEEIYGHYYFPAMCFKDAEFNHALSRHLVKEYAVPREIIEFKEAHTITEKVFGKKIFKGLVRFDYTKNFVFHRYNADEMVGAYRTQIDSGRTQRANKKLFGLLPCGH